MRIFTLPVLAALALGSALPSRAADLDYDVLRGPEYEPAAPVVIDWSGVYLGAHAGYTSASHGFSNVFQPIVAHALRSTVIEREMGVSSLLYPRSARAEGASYGAFLGYNIQFDEIVLGIEADYTRFGIAGTATDAIGRSYVTSNGYYNAVFLNGAASTRVEDYGTIRARAGYAIGSFLPFVTAGLAIGRAKVSDQVAIQAYGYDRNALLNNQAPVGHYGYRYFYPGNVDASLPADPVIYGSSRTKTVGGFALGGGLEYAISSNVVLRGEYQYVLFNDFDGHKVNLNTVRGGAAIKF